MIECKNVMKCFGTLEVLKGVSLKVEKGKTAVLIGGSGSGKTTLLRCINFLEEYDSGEILVDGKLVGKRKLSDGFFQKMTEREIAQSRMEIGIVFQNFNLFPHLTVLENILLSPVHVRRLNRKEVRGDAEKLLEKVGLLDKIDEYPGRLSGGQQQRVAIARALAMKPKVMLFDEVTSALDPGLIEEVLQVIANLAKEGMTMVIVTHEMSFAMDVASEVYFLDDGVIKECGPPKEVLSYPRNEKLRKFLKRFMSNS
jgi:polar amino acid transport system ATP-binding protein